MFLDHLILLYVLLLLLLRIWNLESTGVDGVLKQEDDSRVSGCILDFMIQVMVTEDCVQGVI